MELKRHPNLQPLSRQHRDWLMQARNLRDAAAGGSDTADAARRFLAFWDQQGEPHVRYEENQLIASYANHCDVQADPAIKTMLAQHTQIRHLVERLGKTLATTQPVAPVILELGRVLEEHIRHEERTVFMAMQARIPDAELRELPAVSSACFGKTPRAT